MIAERINPALQGKEVLVVDDDPMILRSLKLMLGQAGLNLRMVNNGMDALKELTEKSPDIIILDYMMPGLNGAQVFDRIRTDNTYERARQTPVIMLTAKTDNYLEQRELFKKGLSAYLFKPFGQKELFNVLGNIVVLEEARRENERLSRENTSIKNFLQGVFDSITDIVSIQTDSFEIIRNNKAADDWNEPLSDNTLCFRRYFGQTEVCQECPAIKTLKTGHAGSARLHNGDSIFEIRTYPVERTEGRGFVEIIKDITAQHRVDAKVAESAKLAGIGTLAAGVAHEINNPLSIILGSAEAMMSETQVPPGLLKDLSTIANEAQRCGRIVHDLLDYARPSPSEPVPGNLNEMCQHAVGLVRHFIKKKSVELEESYDVHSEATVVVDAKKITQVLINVLMNAVQATAAGGRIRVATILQNGMAEASVADTGCGIDEEDLPRVFEPFFSRKQGQGIGLGLAVSKTIVTDNRGVIDIKSRVGSGTTVSIRFPGKMTGSV